MDSVCRDIVSSLAASKRGREWAALPMLIFLAAPWHQDTSYLKRGLSLRRWQGGERHPEPHSACEITAQLRALLRSYVNPSSLPFLARAFSKPHAASPVPVSRHQNSGPFKLLMRNWICYPRDKEKYTFCLQAELKPIPTAPLKVSQITFHLYPYDAIATDAFSFA